MNLDEFISETLKAIIKGVRDSQEFAHENGARVNPIRKHEINTKTIYYKNEDGMRALTDIDFDIAVTASNQQGSGIDGGIKVFSVSLGGKLEDKNIHETVSRVKFNVGVVLPSVVP